MRAVCVIAGSLALLGAVRGADPLPGGGRPPAAWGKPVDGLQAGILPAASPQRVASGTVLEYEVVVRNVQDRGVISLSYPAGLWYSGKAEKGDVELSPGVIGGRPLAEGVQLSPGAEVVLGRVFLGLPGAKPNSGHLTELPAGAHRVGSEGVFPPSAMVPPGNALPPGARYSPELRTGYLDVELRAAK